MNAFKVLESKLKNSPVIILIWLCFALVLAACFVILWEDYFTTLYGYEQWGTAKANDIVNYAVALLPQALTIGSFGWFLLDTKKRGGYLILSFCMALIDIVFDVWFKSHHLAAADLVFKSIFESIFIYTIGGHFLLTFAFGSLISLFPDFAVEVVKFMHMISNAFAHAQSLFGEEDEADARKPVIR